MPATAPGQTCLTPRDRGKHPDVTDSAWLDLTSALTASADEELRGEAADLLAAEAARCRLTDRAGPAVVRLDDGTVVRGTLVPDAVEGWLAVEGQQADAQVLVNVSAVVTVVGSRPTLRRDDGRLPVTIGSWLREAHAASAQLRAVLAGGEVVVGRPTSVGADHAELTDAGRAIVVRTAAVRRWERID